MVIAFLIIAIISLSTFAYIQQKKFGKSPSGERLKKIRKSSHYKNGKFWNKNHTPILIEGVNYFNAFKGFFFDKKQKVKPIGNIPSVKTNLFSLDTNDDVLVWFGHSSYFIQIDGKKILVDPVLFGSASPIPIVVKAFNGTDQYTIEDIPEIDYLFITHDHWDHLDYKTLRKLKPKIKKIICGLGIGAHLEYWGFYKNIIVEKDWNEKIILGSGFTSHTVPARHFSGRGFQRNKSLWTSFVLQTPTSMIFFGVRRRL